MIKRNDTFKVRKAGQVIRKVTPGIKRTGRKLEAVRSPSVKRINAIRQKQAITMMRKKGIGTPRSDSSGPPDLPYNVQKKFQKMKNLQRQEVIRKWSKSQAKAADYERDYERDERQGRRPRDGEKFEGSAAPGAQWEKGASENPGPARQSAEKQNKTAGKSSKLRYISSAAGKAKSFAAFVEAEDKAEQVKSRAVNKMKSEAYQLGSKPVKAGAKALGKELLTAVKAAGSAMMQGIGAAAGGILLPVLLIFLCMSVLLVAVMAFGQKESSQSNTADGMPLYHQYDPQWGSVPYGGGTIASSGCGITSMAMIVSYWTGDEITPDMLVEEWGNKYYVSGVGSNMYGMAAGAKEKFGLSYQDLGNDINKVMRELEQGRTVIASCHKGIFTSGGHIIVLRGLDENNKILVNDPNDNDVKDYYNRPFDKKTIAENCKYYISMWGDMTLEGDDADLLARLIQCEAGSSWISDLQQRLTVSVVINRVRSPLYPNTIHEVIYQSGQFAPAMNGQVDTVVPSSRVIKNVNYVLKNGPVDTQVTFFANFKQGTVKYTFENPYLAEGNKYKYSYFGY